MGRGADTRVPNALAGRIDAALAAAAAVAAAFSISLREVFLFRIL